MSSAKAAIRRLEHRARWDNEAIWRYVENAPATARYRRSVPQLDGAAEKALAELQHSGVAVTSLEALTGDSELLGRIQEYSWDYERKRRADQPKADGSAEKPFLAELFDSLRPEIDPASVLVETALHPQIKGIADRYFGLTTRVNDVNVWRNVPHHPAPSSSQLWHRDIKTDRVMVKAFIYLEPVTADNGPFAYAVGTHPRGEGIADLPVFFDGMNDRVPVEEAGFLHDREEAFTGPAGTIVLADMLGYHRGGFVRDDSRFLLQVRYASLASTHRNLLKTPPHLAARPRHPELAYARTRRRRRPA